jgi:hypothetical protein
MSGDAERGVECEIVADQTGTRLLACAGLNVDRLVFPCEMDETCSPHGGNEKCVQNCSRETPKRRNHSE